VKRILDCHGGLVKAPVPDRYANRKDNRKKINNLNINILYFVCNPARGQEADGTARYEDVVNAFSDIPESNISAVIGSMIADKLISMGPSRRRITITKNGIHRLQASVACRIHRFDGCQCGASPNQMNLNHFYSPSHFPCIK
jgi:hypothetical protein